MQIVEKKQNWNKKTGFNKMVFRLCDVFGIYPLCNWGRCSEKGLIAETGVRYGDMPRNEGDIYYREDLADKKKPVFLQIHGGGFVGSNRTAREALSKWYARQGYFVYNINYTLAPERHFPQGIIDCVGAFNWLVEHAEKYNLDVDKIVVGGDSAGGYYSSAVGAVCTSPELQAKYGLTPLGKPRALVLDCGLYDIPSILDTKIIFNMQRTLAPDISGLPFERVHEWEYYKEASTLDYVSPDYPACYVVWAKSDMFCQGQGERLIEKLKEHGVYCEEYGGVRKIDNHIFPVFWFIKSAKESNAKLTVFLKKVADGEI